MLAVRHHRTGVLGERDDCGPVLAFLENTLADQYLKEDGRKFFLTTEGTSISLPDLKNLSRDQRKAFETDPLWPLYRKLEKVDGVDPQKRCPSLEKYLSNPRVRDRFTQNRPRLRKKEDDWDGIFVSVSMPAISADGREAIMMTGITFAPLAGGGNEVYLRRNRHGRWVVKYQQPTWIS